MDGNERREQILKILKESSEPVSGSALAGKLGVSRQVIVQDIALLRAVDKNILSAARGYILYETEKSGAARCFHVSHTTEEIEDELNLIVDHGGKILDVIVSHEIYGSISVDLILRNRSEVAEFMQRVRGTGAVPLKELTAGNHFHTVEAETEKQLDEIEKQLRKKGYLISEE